MATISLPFWVAKKSSIVAWWTISRYLSVHIAPRRLYFFLPIMCTLLMLKELAFLTIVPILKSCSTFSIATSRGLRFLSRAAKTSSFDRPLYSSMRFLVSSIPVIIAQKSPLISQEAFRAVLCVRESFFLFIIFCCSRGPGAFFISLLDYFFICSGSVSSSIFLYIKFFGGLNCSPFAENSAYLVIKVQPTKRIELLYIISRRYASISVIKLYDIMRKRRFY